MLNRDLAAPGKPLLTGKQESPAQSHEISPRQDLVSSRGSGSRVARFSADGTKMHERPRAVRRPTPDARRRALAFPALPPCTFLIFSLLESFSLGSFSIGSSFLESSSLGSSSLEFSFLKSSCLGSSLLESSSLGSSSLGSSPTYCPSCSDGDRCWPRGRGKGGGGHRRVKGRGIPRGGTRWGREGGRRRVKGQGRAPGGQRSSWATWYALRCDASSVLIGRRWVCMYSFAYLPDLWACGRVRVLVG